MNNRRPGCTRTTTGNNITTQGWAAPQIGVIGGRGVTGVAAYWYEKLLALTRNEFNHHTSRRRARPRSRRRVAQRVPVRPKTRPSTSMAPKTKVEVGDRAEDLKLKEVMQSFDMKARGDAHLSQMNSEYERLGIKKISPGSYFGGTPSPPPSESCDQSVKPSAREKKIGKACAAALFDKSAFDGRVSSLSELDAEGAYAAAVQHRRRLPAGHAGVQRRHRAVLRRQLLPQRHGLRVAPGLLGEPLHV